MKLAESILNLLNATLKAGEITHLRAFRPKQYSTTDDPSNCPSLHIRLFGITGLLPPRPLIVPFILPSITSVSKVLPFSKKNQPLGGNTQLNVIRPFGSSYCYNIYILHTALTHRTVTRAIHHYCLPHSSF